MSFDRHSHAEQKGCASGIEKAKIEARRQTRIPARQSAAFGLDGQKSGNNAKYVKYFCKRSCAQKNEE